MKYEHIEFFANLLSNSVKTGRKIQWRPPLCVDEWSTFTEAGSFTFSDDGPEYYRLEPVTETHLFSVALLGDYVHLRSTIGTPILYERGKKELERQPAFKQWIVKDQEFTIEIPEPRNKEKS